MAAFQKVLSRGTEHTLKKKNLLCENQPKLQRNSHVYKQFSRMPFTIDDKTWKQQWKNNGEMFRIQWSRKKSKLQQSERGKLHQKIVKHSVH